MLERGDTQRSSPCSMANFNTMATSCGLVMVARAASLALQLVLAASGNFGDSVAWKHSPPTWQSSHSHGGSVCGGKGLTRFISFTDIVFIVDHVFSGERNYSYLLSFSPSLLVYPSSYFPLYFHIYLSSFFFPSPSCASPYSPFSISSVNSPLSLSFTIFSSNTHSNLTLSFLLHPLSLLLLFLHGHTLNLIYAFPSLLHSLSHVLLPFPIDHSQARKVTSSCLFLPWSSVSFRV